MTPIRALLPLALAALLAAPAASRAQARASSMRGGVLLGFEDLDRLGGVALRFDGELEQRPLSPVVRFSVVGSVGFSHLTDDDTFFDERYEWTLNVFKFVPAARLTLGRSQSAGVYVDGGLGLYHATLEYNESWTGYSASFDDSETSLLMRFGAGGFFEPSPGLRLGAEVGLTPYFGDVDETSFSALASLSFRL